MIDLAPRPDKEFNYDEAFLYCLTLTYNGHKDWRIPTRAEYEHHDSIYATAWHDGRMHRGANFDFKHITQPVRTVCK